MSLSRSEFKAAFSVSERVADWLATALAETDAALASLHRTTDGWRRDGTEGWAVSEQTRLSLREQVAPLRDTDDPAAALLALAPLRTAAIRADAEALDARRAGLSERLARSAALEQQVVKRLDAIDAFSEADAVAVERAALRARLAEARGRAARCELDVADQLFTAISADTMPVAQLMVDCRRARQEQWSCVVSNLLGLRARGAGAVFETELAAFSARADRIQGLIAERRYDLAIDLCVRFALDIQQLDHMLERHRSCADALADLSARLEALTPEPPGIRAALEQAGRQTDGRDYDTAVTGLADLTRRILAAEAHQEHHAALTADHADLTARLDALRPQPDGLAGMLDGLIAQGADIQRLLDAARVAPDAEAAAAALARHRERVEAAEALAEQCATSTRQLDAALVEPDAAQRLRAALAALRQREHSDTIDTQLRVIAANLHEPDADALRRAATDLAAASTLLDQHAAFQRAAAQAADALQGLPPSPELAGQREAGAALLEAARECAAAHLYADADSMLWEVHAACRAAEVLARQIQDYRYALDDADITFEPLWTHGSASRMDAALKALQADYGRAQALGDAGKYAEATALLERLIPQGEVLAVRLDMLESRLTRTGIRALLAREDGPEQLDGLIAELGAALPERAMETALKLRFSMDIAVEPDDGQGASVSLRRLYTMLSLVPESHVKGNASLSKIVLHDGVDGESTYNYGEDSVTLRCGRAQQSRPVPLLEGDEAAMVAEDCQPRDVERPSYFDWATLHEVGHAVDHKLGFMRARQGAEGWIEHGADVGVIAATASKKLAFDEDYILLRLQGRAPEPPPCPDGTSEAGWLDRQAAADAWCAAVSDRLWDDPAASREAALDGRVYQQAYPGLWVSYPLTARAQALSAYQFRSPIEWFAELYAGFHSGLLKDGHPARAWLGGL